MCEVTIVIPNFNGADYLRPCLEAVYKGTRAKTEVIVVDNGSTDGSAEEAEQLYPEASFVLLDKNYGFCRAVNEGIKASKTPYVILLNNDTRIKPGFVEHLLKAVKCHDNVFSVEARMVQSDNPSLIDSAGTFYNALGWAFARGKDKPADRYERRGKVFAACAGAAIYRRDVFQEIGFFDEHHFAYLEDVDIGYRARIYGYVNLFEPKAEVEHVGSAASGSRYNEFKTRYSARNNIYLIYKNMPLIQLLLNAPLLFIGFAVKSIFFFQKGMGKLYLTSLREGVHMCQKSRKVPFEKKNLLHYGKIQVELWVNVFREVIP